MTKRRVRRPVEQGDIDGLCAIYATLNACKSLASVTCTVCQP